MRRTILLLALILLTGCYEAPVRQSLEFLFGESGVDVTIRTEIRAGEVNGDNKALSERISALRRELAAGRDAFTVHTAGLSPEADTTTLTRDHGEPVTLERTLTLADRVSLKRFFQASSVTALYSEGPGWAELTFLPKVGGSATRDQLEKAVRAEAEWSEAFAQYLRAAAAFWRYVEDHPARRAPLTDAVIGSEDSSEDPDGALTDVQESDVVPESEVPMESAAEPELSETETSLAKRLDDAMEDVLGRLAVAPDEAYSPSELVRLAHDPFPADVSVRVLGKVLEAEGFNWRRLSRARADLERPRGDWTRVGGARHAQTAWRPWRR